MNAAPTTPLRALIVDDEPPARRKVRLFLERDPQIEIVGEADSGEKAVDGLLDLLPQHSPRHTNMFMNMVLGAIEQDAGDDGLREDVVLITVKKESQE